MLDMSVALDTYVVDDPDAPTGESEIVVQAHLPESDGLWHKLLPDHSATSCGQLFSLRMSKTRRECLIPPLCPKCFTEFEISLSNDEAAVKAHSDSQLVHITFADDLSDIRHPDWSHIHKKGKKP